MTERIEEGEEPGNRGNRGEGQKREKRDQRRIKGHLENNKRETDHEMEHNCPDDIMPR